MIRMPNYNFQDLWSVNHLRRTSRSHHSRSQLTVSRLRRLEAILQMALVAMSDGWLVNAGQTADLFWFYLQIWFPWRVSKCKHWSLCCFLNQYLKVVITWQTNSGLSALDRDSLFILLLCCICLSRQRLRAAVGSLLFNMIPNTNRLFTATVVEGSRNFQFKL